MKESSGGWESILQGAECLEVQRKVGDLRKAGNRIYPREEDVFRAFKDCPFESVKVVILGQDPYINKGQATGRAFAVSESSKIPPSLRNIFREVEREYPSRTAPSRSLESWAAQGVFLLNTALTVEQGSSDSHADVGWKAAVTCPTLKKLSHEREHLVFMLWGGPAQKFERCLDAARHLVLKASHPSPLGERKTASPFRGCGHFLRANDYLHQHGIEPINWTDADGNANAKIPRSA